MAQCGLRSVMVFSKGQGQAEQTSFRLKVCQETYRNQNGQSCCSRATPDRHPKSSYQRRNTNARNFHINPMWIRYQSNGWGVNILPQRFFFSTPFKETPFREANNYPEPRKKPQSNLPFSSFASRELLTTIMALLYDILFLGGCGHLGDNNTLRFPWFNSSAMKIGPNL